jgi:excisionase family DNA binding protein
VISPDHEVEPREPRLLVTVEEAARRLSVGRSTVYACLRRGEIPSVRIGHLRRIAVSDLETVVGQLRRGVFDRNREQDLDEGAMPWIDDLTSASRRR